MKKYVRIICLVLIMSLLLAVPVSAEVSVQPYGSIFFAAHDTFLYKTGSGSFEVYFEVTATGKMQKLGVSSIEVERSSNGENWIGIKTYRPANYPQMQCENSGFHVDCVLYDIASPGYYYRAYVTFYAKNSAGTGELSRYTETLLM